MTAPGPSYGESFYFEEILLKITEVPNLIVKDKKELILLTSLGWFTENIGGIV